MEDTSFFDRMISNLRSTSKKLDQNFLTGSIPAFLGNLSSLEILAFCTNNLSGSLPPQLRSLTNLDQI
ncbi:hypothetical protein MKW98_020074 [Papaver atlanticum]|uniref:Uncharacterized protein n=1 Tax=Papaver atlanticum TaxID=357466 RepID=A0AAD4X648_9MAGN|nr:hypothetical protein MKW98_020074 [Papaver atlanticum]